VDPSKAQAPRDPEAIEKAKPEDLLAAAQNRLKERKKLP